ncbi:recombination protein O N-terminal domain-containing protein [uncultured Croceicoccus sp.]|uniref:DNA repair protein RecO n=1 Tax=uncultured Croceicoccus sp. TaxID=1295329 RepID=UPI002625191F|nr:recombination protein O N-terminal domain-containing protein [uncultured Croceicoccus sp.]
MHLRAAAILCASRPHGETAAIARVLTRDHGLVAGYVAGGRGRVLRPVLIPGNAVAADIAARAASQLPFIKLELLQSRAPWMTEPLPAAAIQWATALTASCLPERHPYPAVHDALGPLLDAICHAPSARGWAVALLRYETLLLREMGYGGAGDTDALDWDATLAALEAQGSTIATRLLAARRGDVMAARTLLMARLTRITGES